MAAINFTINGILDGQTRIQLEHVNRIGLDAAPDWPVCRGGDNCYRVLLEGRPKLTCELDMEDEHGGDGGFADAARGASAQRQADLCRHYLYYGACIGEAPSSMV